MKLLVFSDVHLGSGASIPGRPDDQERTLRQVADLAVERRVDAVLFGGDMFEGPGVPSSHYLRVRRALCRPLADAGISIVAISGNQTHDSAGNQGEDNAMAVLRDPWRFAVYTRPGLLVVDDERGKLLGTVACVPWASVARLRAMLNGGDTDDVDALASQLVVRIMGDLREQARREHPDLPCIGLSHFATTGWKTPTGLPTDGEVSLGVVLPLDELERIGFDALFMGHIHAPGVINGLDERPAVERPPSVGAGRSSRPIVSLGSPLCLNHGEATVKHGVWIWEDGEAKHIEIPGRDFLTLEYDLANLIDEPAWADLPAAAAAVVSQIPTAGTDRAPIMRVRVKASSADLRKLNLRAIEKAVLAAGAHYCKAEPVPAAREARARVAGLDAADSPLAALDQWIGGQNGAVTPAAAAGLREWTARALETIS